MIFSKLLQASYKGATFLFESNSVTAGRKIVTQEFVNSNQRVVEDLGLLNDTISMTGFIGGDNYFQDRDRLITALKSAGSGQLSHPTLGILTVTAEPYTMVETTGELGRARFELKFIVAQDIVAPRRGGSSASEANTKANGILDKLVALFSGSYNVSSNIPASYLDSLSKIDQVVRGFNTAALKFRAEDNRANDSFFDLLKTTVDGRLTLVGNASLYGERINQLINGLDDLGNNGSERVQLANQLSSFGDTDIAILPRGDSLLTKAQQEIKENRQDVNDTIQAMALISSYRAAPLVEFVTVLDVQTLRELLDEQYFNIIESPILNNDVINDINILRATVRSFLDESEKVAFKIQTVETKTQPATIITYQQYGNLDQFDNIIDINNLTDISFVSGEIDVLTQ